MRDPLNPVSAFAGLPTVAGRGRGVMASERDGLGIAGMTARKSQAASLAQLVYRRFGVELPNGPRRVGTDGFAAAGVGPGSWLMTCEDAGNGFAVTLRSVIADHASVVDLSDARVVLRLAGPRLRETLAKLVPIDLHERSFKPGDVARTVAAHMEVTLWRLDDRNQDTPAFELSVGRSYTVSLYRALCDSAAEFGFAFEPAKCQKAGAPYSNILGGAIHS